MGHLGIFRGEQPVNNQQSSEAEDNQLTQDSELEIENIGPSGVRALPLRTPGCVLLLWIL